MSRFGGIPIEDEQEVIPTTSRFGGGEPTVGRFGGVPVHRGDEGYRSSAESEVSEWDAFWLNFRDMKSLSEAGGDVLQQTFLPPMGRIQITDPATNALDIKYIPPSDELKEAAGRGDEEHVAAILNTERDKRLQLRYPHLYSPEGEIIPEAENLAGSIAGAIIDPSSLIPFGAGLKAMVATGTALGAIDGALYSKSETGEVDPKTMAIGAVLGGTVPVALTKTANALKIAVKGTAPKINNSRLDKYEKEFAREIGKGVSTQNADIVAKTRSGIYEGGKNIEELYLATGRTPKRLTDPAQARQLVEDIEQEAASSFLRNGVMAVGRAVEPYIGTVSTRIRGISPRIFNTVRKVDLATHVETHNYFSRIEGFSKAINRLQRKDKGTYNQLKKALMGEDFTKAKGIFTRLKGESPVYAKLSEDFQEVRKVLDEVYGGYKSQGYKLKRVAEYFPKLVKNPEGIGVVRHSIIKQALVNEAKRLKRDLTQADTKRVIGSLMTQKTGQRAQAKVGKAVRARKFDYMTEEMLPHYAEINDSLHAYIRQGVHDIQRRKWLGAHGVKVKSKAGVDPKGNDLEGGIGQVVATEVERLGLDSAQEDALLKGLRARFGKGEQGATVGIQHFKNITYGTTLGNIFSAITQLGDNAFGMYLNGIRNHMSSLFGKKHIKNSFIGISNASEDLLSDVGKTKRFLDATLKWSGFSRLDRLGKESILTGSMKKYKQQLKTAKGTQEFRAKWGKFFEEETDDLITKIKSGKLEDDNVRLLMWHSLSDVQPIGLSEMPEMYLNHPNGRVFYMLKTFTIKQFDLMRREIIQESMHGNKAKAAQNAVKFATLFGLVNASADALKGALAGDEIKIDDIMVNNVARLVGLSRYTTQQMAKDGAGQILFEMILPPTSVVDKPIQAIQRGDITKALEPVPIVGKLIAKRLRD